MALSLCIWKRALLAIAAAGTAPLGLHAQSFYEGKTLTIVVGTDVGGGYDLYGRTVARHLGRHVPGKPSVIVQNMPGAGSARAAEYLYVIAPKDGGTIGLIFPGMVVEPLMQPGKFRFDPTKFEYLGSADSGTRLCVTYKTSKIKTFEDALKLPSTFGGSAPGSSTTDYAQMLVNLAGAKMRIVNGYKSSIDTVLAMERGEVDGICGYDSSSFRAQKGEWFNSPEAYMIIQAALEPNPELTRLGVPHIWKYVTGENRRIAEVVLAQQEFHRPFLAPPGVPADRLAILRAGFMATMTDADFLADAKKMKLSISPKDARTVTELVLKMYASPPDLVDKVNKALKP
jgi:tripartite-type tricarboxylate transporter receptor subunit TctC